MSQDHARLVGLRLPAVRVGEMIDGQLRSVRATDVLAQGNVIIAGMPAAFSPVCSEKHLPSLVRNADRLRKAGFSEVVCVATSDPFSLDAWARVMDPARKVRFLSDRNLSFVRALGLSTHQPRLFLGECSERYMLTVRDGVIVSARVEADILELSCTESDTFVLEEA